MELKNKVEGLNETFTSLSVEERIKFIEKNFGDKATFSSSLGIEDQAITHLLVQNAPSVNIFTLDTGRVFPETYGLLDNTNKKYNINIQIVFPDNSAVEEMVKEKGINLFYDSIENRKQCCKIRKTIPLKRALKGYEVWITGIRKDQSVTRFFNKVVEWDEGEKIIKINPLLEWSEKDVWEFIKKNDIPYNELHDKGFPSIGCQPCTRAIEAGEDVRSGRWWWEAPEHKECGLHNQSTE